ncbi:hypothetical protein HDU86_004698 [Geranomyces michiganensis]|nr:hypothetical protein HDU86_004698 [Geranomyces michiganensis]
MTTSSSYAPLARENRAKVLANLASASVTSGAIYLRGHVTTERKWTDCEQVFRQESNFFYLSGVSEPDFHLVIDVSTKETHIFIPKFSADHEMWCGPPPTVQETKQKYGVEHSGTVDEIPAVLAKLNASKVHALEQETEFSALGSAAADKVDKSALSQAVIEARMLKSSGEIDILRKAAKISGDAHIAVMKAVGSGTGERELHALFEYECFRQGSGPQAYTPIIASGHNGRHASVLHYVHNGGPLDKTLLVDAGCEVDNYAADITRTFPVNGKYEGDFKTTYEITLAMQNAVLAALKPGVKWEDMHRLAERVAAEGLLKAGLVKGDVAALLEHHIPAIFFPHGLGHSLGLDVHDVGGYPKDVPRIAEPGIKYLRMRRTLAAGMVVTVEPGIYFVDPILDAALADPNTAKFLNADVVERFRKGVGGVRIEDDVVITKTGIENLTGFIPKEIADVEKVMRG